MTSVGARIDASADGPNLLPSTESLRKPAARADTGRMLSSIAFTLARSCGLADATCSGGVASTSLVNESRATCSPAQNRKSDPISRISVASTQGASGGAESANAPGL